MKNITFKFELVDRLTKDGKYPIQLRITQNGKHKRKMSVLRVKSKKDFNKNASQDNWIRPSEPNHKKWNQILSDELANVKTLYKEELNKGGVTASKLIEKINSKYQDHSFLQIIKERGKQLELEGGIRNVRKYVGLANKLEIYLQSKGKKDLVVSEFDTKFLSEFRTYLFTLRNVKHQDKSLHPNTIAGIMNTLKAVVNHTINTLKYMKMDENPFIGTKYCSEIDTQRNQLSESEITLLENNKLEPYSLQWHCCNFFLFSLYMGGIRAGDLIQMKWCHIKDGNRLNFQSEKTSKWYNLEIHSLPNKILKFYSNEDIQPLDYIFPFLKNNTTFHHVTNNDEKKTLKLEVNKKRLRTVNNKNSLINKYLKKVRTNCGIETEFTCHISRHSFGRKAKDNNVDSLHLKTIYQHSSIRETDRYMGGFPSCETDKILAGLFDKSYNKKNILCKFILGLDEERLDKLIDFVQKEITSPQPFESHQLSMLKMNF